MILSIVCLGTAKANLVPNGSFEAFADGTTSAWPPNTIDEDTGTFDTWRVFNYRQNIVSNLSATIIPNASDGNHAMRLDVVKQGDDGWLSHGLDIAAHMIEIPDVSTGYKISFDAAWIAGTNASNLALAITEFDYEWNNLNEAIYVNSVSDTSYQNFTVVMIPKTNTYRINISFVPMYGVAGASATTLSIDNVEMEATSASFPVNGSFESSPIGTTATLTTSTSDATTFLGWNLFSFGAPPITSFSGTIVDAGSYAGGQAGSHAMLLAVDNTGSPAANADYMLNNEQHKIPVIQGNDYAFSFDMALDSVTGGTMANEVAIEEYDVNGTWLAVPVAFTPALPIDSTFHNYSTNYTPQNTNATQVRIAFRPRNPGYVSTLLIDNVEFHTTTYQTTPPEITYSTSGDTLSLTWPTSHRGWIAQSNSVSLVSDTWVDIPGSESVTTLDTPMGLPKAFYRLRLPLTTLLFSIDQGFGNGVVANGDLEGLTNMVEALEPLREKYHVAVLLNPHIKDKPLLKSMLDSLVMQKMPFVLDVYSSDTYTLGANCLANAPYDSSHGLSISVDQLADYKTEYGPWLVGIRFMEIFGQDYTVRAIKTTNPEWARPGDILPEDNFFRPDLAEEFIHFAKDNGMFVQWADFGWIPFSPWDPEMPKYTGQVIELLHNYPDVVTVTYNNNEPNEASLQHLGTWHTAVEYFPMEGAAGYGLSNQSWLRNLHHMETTPEEMIQWSKSALDKGCGLIQFEPAWYFFNLPLGTFELDDYTQDPQWAQRGEAKESLEKMIDYLLAPE